MAEAIKRYTVPTLLADAFATGIVQVEGMLVVSCYLTFLVERVGDGRGVLIVGEEVRRALHSAPADYRLPPGRRGPTGVHGVNLVEYIGIVRMVGDVGHAGIEMFPRILYPSEFDYEDADSGKLHFVLPPR